MTTEQQYAAMGKAHADLKEAKQRLKALQATAADMGKQLYEVGQYLQGSPQLTGLSGESPMPADLAFSGNTRVYERKLFNADKFRDVTNGIRETMAEIERLEGLLR